MKKLLKYDLKAIGRLWWIIAVASVVLSILGGLSLRISVDNLMQDNEAPIISVFLLLFGIISIFIVVAGTLATLFLTHARFYKNLFTDEGYLTFTLPVTRSSILFSKTLNSFIWQTAHFALIALCALIYISLFPRLNIFGEGMSFSDLFDVIFPSEDFIIFEGVPLFNTLVIFEIILLLLSTSVFGICLIQLCITIGSIIAKKSKVLVAVVIYIVATNVVGIATQLLTVFATVILGNGFYELSDTLGIGGQRALIAIGIMIVFLIISTVTAIIYAVTQHLINHKLNLS